ncbi:tyrosine-type recombinase/integrase [Glutamicibacter sp. AOP5-A2-18]|uniref:tyrosine-type recombinase/integrase n=1 Tax=Glutamicibacter sp. AOP5-A2-18 TaxID=3457656 RepID=UPI0040341E11
MATGRINDLWHRKDRSRTTRYGSGKRWQAIWTDGTDNVTKRSFDYKDAAQAWLDSKTTDYTLNPHGLKADMLFKDFWDKWRQQQTHQRASSLRMIDSAGRKRILPAFVDRYLTEIKREDIQATINSWIADGMAPSTARLYYAYMRQAFKEAVFQKIIRESPCVKISLPQVESKNFQFSKETLDQLIELVPEPYATAMRVGAATGLRPSELFGLSKQDIDFPNSVIRLTLQDASRRTGELVRGPLKTKSSRRSVSFGPVMRNILLELCNASGPEGRLFHAEGLVQIWKYEAVWVKARRSLPEIGPGWHQLRHYHASVLISHGFSPVAVAARLGHKDANETLRTYAHMWDSDGSAMAAVSDTVVAA